MKKNFIAGALVLLGVFSSYVIADTHDVAKLGSGLKSISEVSPAALHKAKLENIETGRLVYMISTETLPALSRRIASLKGNESEAVLNAIARAIKNIIAANDFSKNQNADQETLKFFAQINELNKSIEKAKIAGLKNALKDAFKEKIKHTSEVVSFKLLSNQDTEYLTGDLRNFIADLANKRSDILIEEYQD